MFCTYVRKPNRKRAEQVDLCVSRWSIKRRRRAEASRGHLCRTVSAWRRLGVKAAVSAGSGLRGLWPVCGL